MKKPTKIISVFLIFIMLTGCATWEHQRIRSNQERQQAELGIPEYGINNRSYQSEGYVNGSIWWFGTEKIKELLK